MRPLVWCVGFIFVGCCCFMFAQDMLLALLYWGSPDAPCTCCCCWPMGNMDCAWWFDHPMLDMIDSLGHRCCDDWDCCKLRCCAIFERGKGEFNTSIEYIYNSQSNCLFWGQEETKTGSLPHEKWETRENTKLQHFQEQTATIIQRGL